MDINGKDFTQIGSIIQIIKLLEKDPIQAVSHIRKYRASYPWISDIQLDNIENEQIKS
jgi:hypothetical protein